MILTFTFEGNTPSKKNQKRPIINTRTKKMMFLPSLAHKAWHREALATMLLQKARLDARFPIQKCKRVGVTLFYGDLRARDNSNTWESIADLLVDAGVLEDDSWLITGPTYQLPHYRKGRPGWECHIETEDAHAT